ncbi:MAG: mechanosensitive ion channel family protein [Cyanobacteriota bacterium]|nr:mechanosensitive ion channel family protein [Cyanobacteriota bacterium]
MFGTKKQVFSIAWRGILSLLTLIFCLSLTSVAQGQLPFPLDINKISNVNQVLHSYQTIGNLAVAPVKLDGSVLFNLASPLNYRDQLDTQSVPPAPIRAKQVERILQRIIKTDTLKTVKIQVGILNNQTVILASDQKYPNFQQPIVTVTVYEAQLYGSPVEELAEEGARIIYSSLMQAWQERKPEYLWTQAVKATLTFLGIIITSIILVVIKTRLNNHWRSLKRQEQESQQKIQSQEPSNEGSQNTEESYNEERQRQLLELEHKRRKRDWFFLWRRFITIGIFSIWFWGLVSILRLFPQTRGSGIWLQGKPAVLIGIWLLTGVLKKISDIVINRSLNAWAEDRSFKERTSPRLQLRIATYATALKGIMTIISIIVGLWLTLWVLEIPETTVLAGAGILGVALSFGAQELIKNALSGFFILSIDPYAVGDIITVGDVGGFVEKVSLFYTQVRNADGEVITIPHSTIRTIRNSTKEWSRLNFQVKIDYATDVDRAIEIIKEVALDLYYDSEWRDRMIERPPELIGVEDLSHDGILIQTWIKTKPIEQWNVGREFRRRLKRKFDRAGVSIGVPRLELQSNKNGNTISHDP